MTGSAAAGLSDLLTAVLLIVSVIVSLCFSRPKIETGFFLMVGDIIGSSHGEDRCARSCLVSAEVFHSFFGLRLTECRKMATISSLLQKKPARLDSVVTTVGEPDSQFCHRLDGGPPLVVAYIGHFCFSGQSRNSGRLRMFSRGLLRMIARPPPSPKSLFRLCLCAKKRRRYW